MTTNISHAFIIVVLLSSLSACAVQRAQVAQQARTELIGMSKAEILACAGAPVRSEKSDTFEVITYIGGGDSDGETLRYCEVTFVLTDNIVSKVNYSGRTGGLITKGEQCAFVVENCLSSP